MMQGNILYVTVNIVCHTWVFCAVFETFCHRAGCAGRKCHREVQAGEASQTEVDELSDPTFSSLRASCPSS